MKNRKSRSIGFFGNAFGRRVAARKPRRRFPKKKRFGQDKEKKDGTHENNAGTSFEKDEGAKDAGLYKTFLAAVCDAAAAGGISCHLQDVYKRQPIPRATRLPIR